MNRIEWSCWNWFAFKMSNKLNTKQKEYKQAKRWLTIKRIAVLAEELSMVLRTHSGCFSQPSGAPAAGDSTSSYMQMCRYPNTQRKKNLKKKTQKRKTKNHQAIVKKIQHRKLETYPLTMQISLLLGVCNLDFRCYSSPRGEWLDSCT